MKLYVSLCRALQQRNRSSPTLFATSDNAHTLNLTKSESAFRSSYQSSNASTHRGYGYRAAASEGSHHLAWLHLHGCGPSSYASGLRALHCIAPTNYRQLGYNRDIALHIKDCRLLAVREGRPRSYSTFGGPVLWTLLGANLAVFTMWYKLPVQFMNRHFLVSISSVARGRYHTLLTAPFSHLHTDHLVWNMIALYCFGTMIERRFGGPTLLGLYLFGGLCGSIGHILYAGVAYPLIKKIDVDSFNPLQTPSSLGASGATTCLTMLFIFLYPMQPMLLFMVIPMPAAMVGCIIIGRDVYLAWKGGSKISVGSHLGGALGAFLVYLISRTIFDQPMN